MAKKLDTTGDQRVQGEIEARMSVIHTAIPKVEASITRYEDRLEESRLREDEAHYGDQDQPVSHEGVDDDIQMESSREEEESYPPDADSPGHFNSPEAQPQPEADTEGAQSLASGGNLMVSPEEEEILMGGQTPTKGQSPASDTASVPATGPFSSMPGA